MASRARKSTVPGPPSTRAAKRPRRPKAGAFQARKGQGKTSHRKPSPDLDDILDRLSNALAVIATAVTALAHAQDPGVVPSHHLGEEITTLEQGVTALRAVADELDVAYGAVK
jgi:hypothetical protein